MSLKRDAGFQINQMNGEEAAQNIIGSGKMAKKQQQQQQQQPQQQQPTTTTTTNHSTEQQTTNNSSQKKENNQPRSHHGDANNFMRTITSESLMLWYKIRSFLTGIKFVQAVY